MFLEDIPGEEEEGSADQDLRQDGRAHRSRRHAEPADGEFAVCGEHAPAGAEAQQPLHKAARDAHAEENVQHDADADVSQQRPERAVLFRQMTQRDRRVDLQRLRRGGNKEEHDALDEHPGKDRGKLKLCQHAPELDPALGKARGPVDGDEQNAAQQRDETGDDLEDQRGQPLRSDVRPGRGGQRVHQIALVAEETLVEALAYKDQREHRHRDEQTEEDHGGQYAQQEGDEAAASAFDVDDVAEREADQYAQRHRGDPERPELAQAGAQVVFHQFTKHVLVLPLQSCARNMSRKS